MRQKWMIPSLAILFAMNVAACAMDVGLNEDGEGSYYDSEEQALKQALGDDAKDIEKLLKDEADDPSATDSALDSDAAEVNGKRVYYLRVLWGHLNKAKKGRLKPVEVLPEDPVDDAPAKGKTDSISNEKPSGKPVAGKNIKDAKKIEGVDCKEKSDADGFKELACSPIGKAVKTALKKHGTHWNGFVETHGGKQHAVKAIRFEHGDKLLPCIDGECIGLDTHTTGGVDGVLLRIETHMAKKPLPITNPDGAQKPGKDTAGGSMDAKPGKKPGKKPTDAAGNDKPSLPPLAFVRVAFGNVDFDLFIPLAKLAGFSAHVVVDDKGNQIAIRGFARRALACHHGSHRGRWLANKNGHGIFRGPVRNAKGHRIGRMAGKFGGGKFKGAAVDLSGKLRAIVSGTYDEMPGTMLVDGDQAIHKNGRYRGKLRNFQGKTVGFVRGRWTHSLDGKGKYGGHWRAQCHVDRPCEPSTDEFECADQTDADASSKTKTKVKALPAPENATKIDS
jgi:hypothetical protein